MDTYTRILIGINLFIYVYMYRHEENHSNPCTRIPIIILIKVPGIKLRICKFIQNIIAASVYICIYIYVYIRLILDKTNEILYTVAMNVFLGFSNCFAKKFEGCERRQCFFVCISYTTCQRMRCIWKTYKYKKIKLVSLKSCLSHSFAFRIAKRPILESDLNLNSTPVRG